MTKVLLSLHVLAAILTIGPITVAASMFAPVARRAADGGAGQLAVLQTLHRISSGCAVIGLTVPVLGLATAAHMEVLDEGWLLVSLLLTVVAALLLALRVLPEQAQIVLAAAGPDAGSLVTRTKSLAMTTGVFALLWAVVVVLMIVRPGSTTGA